MGTLKIFIDLQDTYFSLFFSRQPFPFPSTKSSEVRPTSGVVRPLVSEVRPMMEDRVQSAQTESQNSERGPALRLTPQRKRVPSADSRKVTSPVAKAAAASQAGMRKAQSIHNISSEGKTSLSKTNIVRH